MMFKADDGLLPQALGGAEAASSPQGADASVPMLFALGCLGVDGVAIFGQNT